MKFATLAPTGSTVLGDYLIDCAWSPDSKSLAVAGGEGRVYLVQRGAGKPEVREIGSHGMGTLAVAWSPRGTTFATSGQDGSIALWNGADGKELRRWKPSRAWTEHLLWSPDGKYLASAAGKSVWLWRADGELAHEFPVHASTVAAMGWDKPGHDLAVALNGALTVHRVAQSKNAADPLKVTTREYPWGAACLTVSFSPNGKVLATGMQDGSVHFWYLATGKSSQMRGYPGKVQLTGWSANSRYLATSAGNDLVVWDFGGKGPEGSKPLQFAGHTDRIESLAWQPSGIYLVTGGRDWRLSLWAPGKAERAVDAHMTDAEVSVVRWSPDSRFVAVGEQKGALSFYELLS